jgi:hypothetical protein
MTTQIGDGPLTVYLLDGGGAQRIPDIIDFNLVGENPDADDEGGEPGTMNARRARQVRRRRRANPGDITLELDYNPCEPMHQELLAAGESDRRLLLRIVLNDEAGRPVYAHEVECSVLRYVLSCEKLQRRQPTDANRQHSLEAELRLQSLGGFRSVAPG